MSKLIPISFIFLTMLVTSVVSTDEGAELVEGMGEKVHVNVIINNVNPVEHSYDFRFSALSKQSLRDDVLTHKVFKSYRHVVRNPKGDQFVLKELAGFVRWNNLFQTYKNDKFLMWIRPDSSDWKYFPMAGNFSRIKGYLEGQLDNWNEYHPLTDMSAYESCNYDMALFVLSSGDLTTKEYKLDYEVGKKTREVICEFMKLIKSKIIDPLKILINVSEQDWYYPHRWSSYWEYVQINGEDEQRPYADKFLEKGEYDSVFDMITKMTVDIVEVVEKVQNVLVAADPKVSANECNGLQKSVLEFGLSLKENIVKAEKLLIKKKKAQGKFTNEQKEKAKLLLGAIKAGAIEDETSRRVANVVESHHFATMDTNIEEEVMTLFFEPILAIVKGKCPHFVKKIDWKIVKA